MDNVVQVGAQIGVLGAQVDDAHAGADGAAADGHALEHKVGEVAQDDPVFEGAGLAFVGVTDDVLVLALFGRAEVPLHAGRESGAPATLEGGSGDGVDDVAARQRECRLEAGAGRDARVGGRAEVDAQSAAQRLGDRRLAGEVAR